MRTIAVIDYGMGNLHSVGKALESVAPKGVQVIITSDIYRIQVADRVVLPGVGAIRDCMKEVHRKGIDQVIKQVIASRTPLLGICVGMQLLLDHSEENGGVDCLGILPGSVRFFGEKLVDLSGNKIKVPHMGWSQVSYHQSHPVWEGIEENARFYFVHSYHAHVADRELSVAQCHYHVNFDVALARENVFAVQFHPEKSAKNGLRVLENFLKWTP